MKYYLIFLLSGLFVPLSAQEKPPRVILLPPQLVEVSGYWIAGPDDYWWLNDSGNAPMLYRSDAGGRLTDSLLLPVRNRDWEELTGDQRGTFFIGDFGNNKNARKDLQIYLYHQPTGQLDSVLFHFEDQTDFPPTERSDWRFDCEAMIFWRDSLHLFTKDAFAGPGWCKHYVLPAQSGNHTAVLREKVLLKKSSVTGAAIDAEGRHLVLVSYHFSKILGAYLLGKANIHILSGYSDGYFFNGNIQRKKAPYCLIPRQYESIAFFNDRWLLTAAEGVYFQKPVIRRKKLY